MNTPPGGGQEPSGRPVATLPPALPVRERFGDRLDGMLAVFLDYDGTLTPIVDDPKDALLTDGTRRAIGALGAITPVGIVSGRDLDDVHAKVGLDGIAYAGSHGFDVLLPDGSRREFAVEYLSALDQAQRELEERVGELPGARVERKRFAVAVHDRAVDDPELRARIASAVEQVGADRDDLRVTGGKRVHELRPNLDWDKGRAIETLLSELNAEECRPIYVGDDVTDEDGFRAVRSRRGVAVVVRGEDDQRDSLADAVLDTVADTQRLLVELRELAVANAGADGLKRSTWMSGP